MTLRRRVHNAWSRLGRPPRYVQKGPLRPQPGAFTQIVTRWVVADLLANSRNTALDQAAFVFLAFAVDHAARSGAEAGARPLPAIAPAPRLPAAPPPAPHFPPPPLPPPPFHPPRFRPPREPPGLS